MNTSRKKYNIVILLSFFSAFCFLGCNEEETEPSGELVKQSLCLHESLDSRDDVTPTNQDCIKYEYDGESTLLLKHLNAG
ncbi:MAG: hypothetical protein GY870_13470, partial [archaeon]|nr:hypothetical protein [archaeon]